MDDLNSFKAYQSRIQTIVGCMTMQPMSKKGDVTTSVRYSESTDTYYAYLRKGQQV